MFLPWLGESSSSKMTSVASFSAREIAQLVDLALAEVGARMRAVDLLHHLADDDRAGRVRELGELAQVLVDGLSRARPLERHAHEERPLDRRGDVDRFSAYEKILVMERLSPDAGRREPAGRRIRDA